MIFDLHNDLLTSELSETQKEEYLLNNQNVKIVLAYWTSKTKKPMPKIEQAVNSFKKFKNVLFAVEDIWFLNDENIDAFVQLPIKYCTLAWNNFNGIAGGHASNDGVSEKGLTLLKKLSENNILIDTAHLCEKSFYDVCDNFDRVFNSHTCFKSVHIHSRNISDAQIKALIEKNGIIGLTFVDVFLGTVSGIEGVVKHIDMFVQKFGYKNLSVGTDFFGTEPIKGLESYNSFKKLMTKLQKIGYNKSVVDDIFYHNADNFFKSQK